nr:unnamed protein product [Digitaria exilis]
MATMRAGAGGLRAQTLRDLADEGKKRAVLLLVFAFGLAFLMSPKIGKEKFVNLPSERRDAELKMTLIAENKLHPALFSANAEYKVLQSLAEGLISVTVKPQDLQCTFFRCTARELLACAVLRPVINLANPRFINERIESLALSRANKLEKGVEKSTEDATTVKQRETSMPSVDEFSALIDHSSPGQQSVPCSTSISQRQALLSQSENQRLIRHSTTPTYSNGANHLPKSLSAEMAEHTGPEDIEVESESSYATEDDEINNVTGLDSPVTRVWESKRRKRSRSNVQKPPIWQEVERSSFPLGDDLDILNASANDSKTDELVEDTEVENSYLKLRCEVVGASIVKSGSGMFAVYSISVTDANGNSWSIKRRFRHFEELHRRLKEYAQYNLHLPPKHFLSSGLEVPVVRERCQLLDIYLKNLLQIPIVSSCIEVWDFLSVDSQTYIFTDSLSVIQTLSASLDERSNGKHGKAMNSYGALNGNFISGSQSFHGHKDHTMHNDFAVNDGLRSRKGNVEKNLGNSVANKTNSVCNTTANLYQDNSGSDPEQNDYSLSIDSVNPKKLRSSETNDTPQILGSDGYSLSPNDWMAPNLSVPLFHLVDVVFQLQDGGWIRRQAFWVAKQLLQLGMGDTFDDWLVDKIQLLRKGRIIAFAVKRVEQILWPDGIFMTKHPQRKTPSPPPGAQNNGMGNYLTDEQRIEAAHRANFVRELIIDKAPSPLVSLVGRKDYEKCAQDIYFFLQSPVCLKQLAFELLELLVLAAFPELDDTVRKWREDKQQFGAMQ